MNDGNIWSRDAKNGLGGGGVVALGGWRPWGGGGGVQGGPGGSSYAKYVNIWSRDAKNEFWKKREKKARKKKT